MAPSQALPVVEDFDEPEAYVDSLLEFATSSVLFQTLCGGVHILDFFTREPSLYDAVIPEDWRSWLVQYDSMDLLDILMRKDLDLLSAFHSSREIPVTLLQYIKNIRRHSLQRNPSPRSLKQSILPRHVASGMIPKKIHEVTHFADYVDGLADDIAIQSSQGITHFLDFGSGQNYLGRALASPPYNKNIIAVESREVNINGAQNMDVLAKVAERESVMRNKKLYRQKIDDMTPSDQMKDKARRRAAKPQKALSEKMADMRPSRDLAKIYRCSEGQGSIQYIEHVVQDGDLSSVVRNVSNSDQSALTNSPTVNQFSNLCFPAELSGAADEDSIQLSPLKDGHNKNMSLLAMSIHSCGNLSHHGIRSLLVNPSVRAIAIIGCCYNLMTERLGPPTYKLPILRPNIPAINARSARESSSCDPHGFPMSERIAKYNGEGIRLNITARMMAVQAPQNWTEKESDAFFMRHFFRALLQKIFLDRGVVSKPYASGGVDDLASEGTDPVIIGSLRKGCYSSFTAYVRGAIEKLTSDSDRGHIIARKMDSLTDEEIEDYSKAYASRQKELSVMWSLMSFSAGVVESLIVVDRWLFLREHPAIVKDSWVEAIFDYRQSPRNLVVVGIKREQPISGPRAG